jgi:uncharacterized membrane protein
MEKILSCSFSKQIIVILMKDKHLISREYSKNLHILYLKIINFCMITSISPVLINKMGEKNQNY